MKTNDQLKDLARRYMTEILAYAAKGGAIPSGYLYAQFMSEVDIHQHTCIVQALKEANLIITANHLLYPSDNFLSHMASVARKNAQNN